MTDCVAVTRGGWGEVFLFENRDQADSHPLIQYGDAILCGPSDVVKQYNTLEMPRLLGMLGNENLRVVVLGAIHPDKGLRETQRVTLIRQYEDDIWDNMIALAQPVPTDPELILQKVREDRALLTKDTTMTETDKTKETKPKATPKPKAEPKPKPYADDAVIKFGADKEGKAYDAKDNNPKRKGTKAHEQFAKFKDGMTVADYVKAIGNDSAAYAELKWCASKGFITIGGESF